MVEYKLVFPPTLSRQQAAHSRQHQHNWRIRQFWRWDLIIWNTLGIKLFSFCLPEDGWKRHSLFFSTCNSWRLGLWWRLSGSQPRLVRGTWNGSVFRLSLVLISRATLQKYASLADGTSSLTFLECLFPLGKGVDLSSDWSILWFSVRWSKIMLLGTKIMSSYKFITLGWILSM